MSAQAEKKQKNVIKPTDGWKDLPWGGIIPAGGTAVDFVVGGWRSDRPIWDAAKCTSCMMCWLYCPDMAIQAEGGKVVGIDYDHCKGCGICSSVCPVKGKAINMVPEA